MASFDTKIYDTSKIAWNFAVSGEGEKKNSVESTL